MKATSEPTSGQVFSISLFLKNNYRIIWWIIFFISLTPVVRLYYHFTVEQLGINPLETLTHTTGQWALIFLLITLSMTPLRRITAWFSRKINSSYGKRISDWNWLIRLKRMLGLFCFFYASVHLFIFLNYDLTWEWEFLWEDIGKGCIE